MHTPAQALPLHRQRCAHQSGAPLSDADQRALLSQLQGWRIDTDIKRGDFRLVQVTPTGDGHVSIAFGVGIPTATPGRCGT